MTITQLTERKKQVKHSDHQQLTEEEVKHSDHHTADTEGEVKDSGHHTADREGEKEKEKTIATGKTERPSQSIQTGKTKL